MIEFYCSNPACAKKLLASDGTAGHPARCPACGTSVVVPGTMPTERAAASGPSVVASRAPKAEEFRLMEEPEPRAPVPQGVDGGGSESALGRRVVRPRRRGAPQGVIMTGVLLVAAAGGAILLLASGGSESTGDFGKAPQIQSKYQGPKVELKLGFKRGRYLAIETQEDSGKQTIESGGRSQDVANKSSVKVEGEVEIKPPQAGTGEQHVTYTCNRMNLSMTQGPQKMSFNSDDPGSGSGSLDMGLATQVNGDLLVEGSMTIRAMGETGKSTMRMTSKQTYTLQAK